MPSHRFSPTIRFGIYTISIAASSIFFFPPIISPLVTHIFSQFFHVDMIIQVLHVMEVKEVKGVMWPLATEIKDDCFVRLYASRGKGNVFNSFNSRREAA